MQQKGRRDARRQFPKESAAAPPYCHTFSARGVHSLQNDGEVQRGIRWLSRPCPPIPYSLFRHSSKGTVDFFTERRLERVTALDTLATRGNRIDSSDLPAIPSRLPRSDLQRFRFDTTNYMYRLSRISNDTADNGCYSLLPNRMGVQRRPSRPSNGQCIGTYPAGGLVCGQPCTRIEGQGALLGRCPSPGPSMPGLAARFSSVPRLACASPLPVPRLKVGKIQARRGTDKGLIPIRPVAYRGRCL
jgi:hypothetical protein